MALQRKKDIKEDKDNVAEAMKRAGNFLAARSHCVFEVEKKLYDIGFSIETAKAASKRCVELNLVDDASYANELISYLRRKGYGIVRISYELKKRRLGQYDIGDEACEDGVTPKDALSAAIRKSGGKSREKTAAFLYRRGFTSRQIREALDFEVDETE